MTQAFVLALAVHLSLAAHGASASDESTSCTALRVGTAEASVAGERRARKKPSFSASKILDLELQVELKGPARKDRGVELKLYTPKGHLYQTLTARVGADVPGDSETRGRRRVKRAQATATLPVAGTTIVTSSLYGMWRVEAHVDGSAALCARAQEFSIEP